MKLPDLTPVPNDTREKYPIKEGVVMYSKVTEIYYKMIKGILYKYPTYGGADRQWSPSMYSMGFKAMKVATKEQIKRLT
jgi:hypothetical protein